MRQSIVVSVLGEDSPGLVAALSKLIVSYQGDWVESSMAGLAGKFAGILRVDLPKDQVEAFTKALESENLGLKVMYEMSEPDDVSQAFKQYDIELIGQDRPGIVHRLTDALARLGGSVETLESEVIEASMSGEQLFKAQLSLKIPLDIDRNEIQQALEAIANELIADIQLADA
ncbi:glycine cleavage system protein R [Hydrogenovibrio kuenenii]|uniref:glycine cleavage system protein R n=1 Tax=Hydrogenovibrio kuenenii TaxID=63658 RepID=UPI000465B386|nr:ACT domain-containing protein [Hydrogenovibrio kuenenii]